MHHRPEQIEDGFLLGIEGIVEGLGACLSRVQTDQLRLHPAGLRAQALYAFGHSLRCCFVLQRLSGTCLVSSGCVAFFHLLIGVCDDACSPGFPGGHLLRLEAELALEFFQGLLRMLDPIEIRGVTEHTALPWP